MEVTSSTFYIDSLTTIFMLLKFHLRFLTCLSIIYGNFLVVNNRWYQVTLTAGTGGSNLHLQPSEKGNTHY